MERIERRQLLKTTGTGVALGVGVASARDTERVETQQSTTTFTATATDGFLTIDSGSKGPNDDSVPLAGSGVNGTFEIKGQINSDGTWQSTSTTLPSFSESQSDELADVTIDVDYRMDGAVTGEIDRGNNVITATMPLRIDIVAEADPVIGGGFTKNGTIVADANNLTTKQSGDMNGSASGLTTQSGSATLVDNELTLPGSGDSDLIDPFFGTPSQTSGRNWMELQFDISFAAAARTSTFTGAVVTNEQGTPVPGITVQIEDNGTTVATATTDANGNYSAKVPPGTYDLIVNDPDTQKVTKTKSIGDEETKTVDFQVDGSVLGSGDISGVVTTISGNLLGGVPVELVKDGQTVAETTSKTKPLGVYELSARAGQYDVVVDSEEYEPFRKEVRIREGEPTNLGIELVRLPEFAQNPIADPNGDGLYEDVRGDGKVGILDVQMLFNQLDSGNPQLQNHSEKFNFSENNPDEVTILDVQALFTQLPE
jgi:hypothetical protein